MNINKIRKQLWQIAEAARSWRNSVSIKAKFNSIIWLLVASFAVMTAINTLSLAIVLRLSEFRDEFKLLQRKNDENNLALSNFMGQYHNDIDFFQTGSSDQYERVFENYERLNRQIKDLAENPLAEQLQLKDMLSALLQLNDEHTRRVAEFFTDKLAIGNDLYGSAGNMNRLARQIAQNSSRPEVLKDLVDLVQIHRSYQVSGNVTSKDDFFNRYDRLVSLVEEDSALALTTEGESVLRQLKEYVTNFEQMVERMENSGSDAHLGLWASLLEQRAGIGQLYADILDLVEEERTATISRYRLLANIALLLVILGFLLYVWLFSRRLLLSLRQLSEHLDILESGALPEKPLSFTSKDELEQMALRINARATHLSNAIGFAKALGDNNFDHQLSSKGRHDLLAEALLTLRDKIMQAREAEDLRKLEDFKRNWATQGYANFADLMRASFDSTADFSYRVVADLVNYMEANQGGLFLFDEDENSLDLKACFAYDRRKYLKKNVLLGEGIIGSCAMEKKTIYLRELPQEYMEISSGLGKASPDCLLVVPLKIEEKVLGILELAAFGEFEAHKIEFAEKLAENIASNLNSMRVAERTRALLEQSRQQSEAMAAQEEEMRQNLEELQATQEESARRESEMAAIIEGLKSTFLVAEFDEESNFIDVNDKNLEYFNLSRSKVLGTNLIQMTNGALAEFWKKLAQGQILEDVHHISSTNKWVSQTYIPIFDNYGALIKVLRIAFDISESKKREKEVERLLASAHEKAQIMAEQERTMNENFEEMVKVQEESVQREAEMQSIIMGIKANFMVTEYSMDSRILEANSKLLNLLGLEAEQVVGREQGALAGIAEQERRAFWEPLLRGQTQTQIQELKANGQSIWLKETYVPILGSDGEPFRVLCIGIDITPTKSKERELQHHAEMMKLQEQMMAESIQELQAAQKAKNNQAKAFQLLLGGIKAYGIFAEIDPDGRFRSVNGRLAALFEQDPDSFAGRSWHDYAQISPQEKDDLWKALREGNAKTFLNNPYRRAGKSVLLTEQYIPLLDEADQLSRVLMVAIISG